MHEALRHHTLLQLKTAGTPPAPGSGLGDNSPNDSNTKFRSGGGMTLRNLLAGKSDDSNMHSVAGRTVTTTGGDPYPAEQAATKCSAYLEMFTSPVSAVQRLMAELLGAADEFRRLHISSSERGNHSAAIDDGDVTPFMVSRASQILLF